MKTTPKASINHSTAIPNIITQLNKATLRSSKLNNVINIMNSINSINSIDTATLSPARIISAEMQPILKRMDFARSQSLPVRSGVNHGSSIGLAKPALMFKIHPYRISASKSDRTCPKCDDLQNQSTCDCSHASKIASSGAMVKDHAEEENEWNVEQVNEIPSYFCIERSHEYYDDLTPSEISKRISDCFGTMQEMISVTYDNDQVRKKMLQAVALIFRNLLILIIHFLMISLLLCSFLGNRKCRKYRQNQARLL